MLSIGESLILRIGVERIVFGNNGRVERTVESFF